MILGRINGDEGFDRANIYTDSAVIARQYTPRSTLLTWGDIGSAKQFTIIDDTVEFLSIGGILSSKTYLTRTLIDGPVASSPILSYEPTIEERDWYYRQSFPALENDYQSLILDSASIQLLYVAYYGRPSDSSGAEFWANVVEQSGFTYAPRQGDGLTQSERPLYDRIVVDFGASTEAAQLYSGLSTMQAVDTIYNFCFNRNAERDPVTGINYWVGQLESGNITLSQAAVEIALGAQGQDLTILGNKLRSADAFAAAINTPEEIATYAGPLAARIAQSWLNDYGPFVASSGLLRKTRPLAPQWI